MDLRTRIGKVKVEGVIGNSPGPGKSIDESHQVGRSPASVITFGSLPLEPREGNSGEVYWAQEAPEVALNSLGLPAIFSGLGFTLELNMTCPNIEKKGIFAYNLEEVEKALQLVRKAAPDDNLVVKLNYHPDSSYIEAMCDVLINGGIDAVALCNTLPNGLVLGEDLKPVITPNNGLAGQSGKSIRPAVMGQVYQYRQILPPDIDIICEGGIWTGFDILGYFAAGGNFCRIATMYAERGVKAFGELTFQFLEEMEKRGYESLTDIPRLEGLPALQTS